MTVEGGMGAPRGENGSGTTGADVDITLARQHATYLATAVGYAVEQAALDALLSFQRDAGTSASVPCVPYNHVFHQLF